jgi:hypothetical protein
LRNFYTNCDNSGDLEESIEVVAFSLSSKYFFLLDLIERSVRTVDVMAKVWQEKQ